MLFRELPDARMLEASSILELRLTPERLTGEIVQFIDGCWERRRRPATRRLGAHYSSTADGQPQGAKGAAEARARGARGPGEGRAAAQADGGLRRRRPGRGGDRGGGRGAAGRRWRRRSGGGGDEPDTAVLPDGGSVPERKIEELAPAAKAAGCTLQSFKGKSREHTDDVNEKIKYDSNPPTEGKHFAAPAEDGAYDKAPDVKELVHALEHGRVVIWFKKSLPEDTARRPQGAVRRGQLPDAAHPRPDQDEVRGRGQRLVARADAQRHRAACWAARSSTTRPSTPSRPSATSTAATGPRPFPSPRRRLLAPALLQLRAVEPLAGDQQLDRAGQDPQVQPHAAVVDVPDVQLDPLGPGDRGAPVDLRPAGDARA